MSNSQISSALRITKVNFNFADGAEEVERIFRFYEENPHNGNRLRDPYQLITTMQRGAAWVVEDTNKKIYGVSFNFPYFDTWMEAGGTRVILEGYGIHKVFFWARILEYIIFCKPGTEYFTIVADWNEKSQKNIDAMGFVRWKPDASMLAAIGKLGEDTSAKEVFFCRLDQSVAESAACFAARQILSLNRNPILTNKRDNTEVHVILDLAVVRNNGLRSLLEGMANSEPKLTQVSR